MGDLVAFAADIEQMGRAFGFAAADLDEVLRQLQRVTDHVRQAFHNHPDQAGAAIEPLTDMRRPIQQVEQLANALEVTLIDVARGYHTKDAVVASGWAQADGR